MTSSIRAFLALEIPDHIKAQLASAQEELRDELPRARWTRPEGWHLTLKFLGEVERPVLADLGCRARSHVFAALARFAVEARERTGFFPLIECDPAWHGSEVQPTELRRVVAAVEEAAENRWFSQRERRPWSVHLTQARLKSQWPKAAVDRFLEWGDNLDLEAIHMPRGGAFLE